jgi:hypothetical protein
VIKLLPLLGFCLNSPAVAAVSLSKIVTPALLGVTLKYAEYESGVPAMREKTDALGTQHNYYERSGCTIFLGIRDNKVVSVGAYVARDHKCDVNVSSIVNKPGTMASSTVFRNYAWRGKLHFTSTQIPACNGCWEGQFNAMMDGYGALGNVDIRLIGQDSKAWDAYDEYLYSHGMDGDARRKLPMTGDNCPLRRYDEVGYRLLQNTPVIGIEFGRFGSLQPQCSGEAVVELNLRDAE